MKLFNLKGTMVMLLLAMLLSPIIPTAEAQTPYQLPTTPKWVGTDMDTVSLPGISINEGFITNEGDTTLIVYFCSRGTITLDSNSYFELGEGKTLWFRTSGKAIYRQAINDSTYSQVYLGYVELWGSNLNYELGITLYAKATGQASWDLQFTRYDLNYDLRFTRYDFELKNAKDFLCYEQYIYRNKDWGAWG